MADISLLSLITFLPLISAVILIVFLRGDDEAARLNAKRFGLLVTWATFALSLFLVTGFDGLAEGFQFAEEAAWIGDLTYRLGVDGLSLPLVMLTTLVFPLAIGASWPMDHRVKEYIALILMLETAVLGVLVSLDLILLYLFMASSLMPLFLLVGIWGGKARIAAAFKMILMWLVGALVMLIAAVYASSEAGSTDITALLRHQFSTDAMTVLGWSVPGGVQTMLWLGFFAGFAVMLPLWPFHTWLTDVQEQAPVPVSALLTAVVIKIAGYGLLRFNLSMFPLASDAMTSFVLVLAGASIFFAALAALVQEDMRRLLAYATVAQMGVVAIAIFSANQQGIDGALLHMVSHGLIWAGLFLLVGMLQNRLRTTEIAAFGGLANRMPMFAILGLLFVLAMAGVPGTAGFAGFFLSVTGALQTSVAAAAVAVIGLILAAVYSLWLYRRVVLGDLIKESLRQIKDLNRGEIALITPLAVLVLVLGLYPSLVTDLYAPAVEALVETIDAAVVEAAAGTADEAANTAAAAEQTADQ